MADCEQLSHIIAKLKEILNDMDCNSGNCCNDCCDCQNSCSCTQGPYIELACPRVQDSMRIPAYYVFELDKCNCKKEECNPGTFYNNYNKPWRTRQKEDWIDLDYFVKQLQLKQLQEQCAMHCCQQGCCKLKTKCNKNEGCGCCQPTIAYRCQ